MNQLNKKPLQALLKQHLEKVSVKALEIAKDNCPVDTDDLALGITKSDILQEGDRLSFEIVYGTGKDGINYAPYLEYGTVRSDAHVGFITEKTISAVKANL